MSKVIFLIFQKQHPD